MRDEAAERLERDENSVRDGGEVEGDLFIAKQTFEGALHEQAEAPLLRLGRGRHGLGVEEQDLLNAAFRAGLQEGIASCLSAFPSGGSSGGAGRIAVCGGLAWPAPIASHSFPTSGSARWPDANRDLEACELISDGAIRKSDKLLVDSEGRVYAGDEAGRIHRLAQNGSGEYELELYAQTSGRPMEMAFDPAGNLIAADLNGSHFSIAPTGVVERLPTLEGLPRGTAGVAVDDAGVLYYGAHTDEVVGGDNLGALYAMLDASPAGELRSYDPSSGRVRSLVSGLFEPVGVELSLRQDFVVVAEFFAYRLTRYWLRGPKAGTWDRLVENLPGFVDGVASDGQGHFLVTIPAPRSAALDWLHERPWLNNQIAKMLPLLVRLGAVPARSPGMVAMIDEQGRIVGSHQDPQALKVSQLTTAEIHEGVLFVGSISGDWIARCPLPES